MIRLGGRMFNISSFLEEYKMGATLKKNRILIGQAGNLDRAIQTTKGTLGFSACEDATEWTPEDAMLIFKELAEAGYMEIKGLTPKLRTAGFSLMKHNIVHYRPCQPIVEDIKSTFVFHSSRSTEWTCSCTAIPCRSSSDEEHGAR